MDAEVGAGGRGAVPLLPDVVVVAAVAVVFVFVF